MLLGNEETRFANNHQQLPEKNELNESMIYLPLAGTGGIQ